MSQPIVGCTKQASLQVSHVLYVASLLVIPCHNVDIASVTGRLKHQHAYDYSANGQHSSSTLYRTMQPECKFGEYLSVVKCISSKRLGSRFRARYPGAGTQTVGLLLLGHTVTVAPRTVVILIT